MNGQGKATLSQHGNLKEYEGNFVAGIPMKADFIGLNEDANYADWTYRVTSVKTQNSAGNIQANGQFLIVTLDETNNGTEPRQPGAGEVQYFFKVIDISNGKEYTARVLILATGGLSYPSTGSTGDGYAWAEALGHTLTERFPSLTALVPEGYKNAQTAGTDGPKHIDRSVPMEKMGKYLYGNKLKNCGLRLVIDGNTSEEEFGDVEFTDGGIEGPVVFQVSRKAVKALRNGSKVSLELDLKAGVRSSELSARLTELWKAIRSDERSRGRSEKNLLTVLLGKLLPWDLVDGFLFCHPEILPAKKGRNGRFFEVDLAALAIALQRWKMDIAGYVGYERCVVTAGGVAMSEIDPKTLSSKKRENLFFCGELLDMDADTGGYNLHLAFCTGYLAGQHAAERV